MLKYKYIVSNSEMIFSTIQCALEPSTGYATVVAVAMTPIVLLSLAPKGNRGVAKRGELTCFTVRQSVLSSLFPLPFPLSLFWSASRASEMQKECTTNNSLCLTNLTI